VKWESSIRTGSINPPFYCDYGSHIEVGNNVWIGGKEIDEEAWQDILRIQKEEDDIAKYPTAKK